MAVTEDDSTFIPIKIDDPLGAHLFFVPLFLQQLLRHPRLASNPASRLFGYALAPVSVYLAMKGPIQHRWTPSDAATAQNIGQSVTAVQPSMHALELAFVTEPFYWVPIDEPRPPRTAGEIASNKDHPQSRRDLAESRHGPLDMLGWTLTGAIGIRGIGWSWGPPLARLPKPHRNFLTYFVYYYLANATLIAGSAWLSLAHTGSRPQGVDGSLAFTRIGVPAFPGSAVAADLLTTFAFGLCLTASMEVHYANLTWFTFVIQSLLSHALPSLVPRFDWRRWPPMFANPHLAESLSDLWGNRWHALFRRSFEVCAYHPSMRLARALGLPKKWQRAAGVGAVFTLSGLMHEFAVHNLHGDLSLSFFPSTLTYFLLQLVGIFVYDPLVNLILPKGRFRPLRIASVWLFTLLSARGFRTAYVAQGLDSSLPEVEHWAWQRFVVPTAVLMPKGVFVKK